MTDSKQTKSIPRREFLRKAGMTSGAVGAAAVALSTGQTKAAISPAKEDSAGYRETEHVRTYYRLARI